VRPPRIPPDVVLLGVLAAFLLPAAAHAPAAALPFRLPLDNYPKDDGCLAWGGPNANFQRCGQPGLHVADDACAPNGTDVLAVARGRLRYAAQVGVCTNNWGWVTVTEHVLEDESRVCAVYGHCQPVASLAPGDSVFHGQHIADINLGCGSPHIHFGIYEGAFGAPTGTYPDWLLGYLPNSLVCAQYPTPFPGSYVDPVAFVEESVPILSETWGRIKATYRRPTASPHPRTPGSPGRDRASSRSSRR
jgi:murein DD-endopeptidase MepM/ murein hydrolase activator NlpD